MTKNEMKQLENYLFVKGEYKEFSKFINYQIKDLESKSDKFKDNPTIIVLESPHFEEIRSGKPASGGTGKELGKELLNNINNKAIGKSLIKSKSPNIVVCNVSNVPLQINSMRRFYTNFPSIEKRYENRLKSLSPYRKFSSDVETQKIQKLINELIIKINDNFKRRLKEYQKKTNANCTILYGETAKKAFFNCRFKLDEKGYFIINGNEVKVQCERHPSPINK